jgi:tripartite-type tricarboxylate transporter receptor subunit TctC
VAGESHWTIAPAPATMSLVRAGRLRAIAHSLPQRSALFGDLPAVAETLPGYDYSGWAGLLSPKGLAPAQVERLRAALAQVLANPRMRELLAAQGAAPQPGTPEEFRQFLGRDLEATARVVKAAGIQPE